MYRVFYSSSNFPQKYFKCFIRCYLEWKDSWRAKERGDWTE